MITVFTFDVPTLFKKQKLIFMIFYSLEAYLYKSVCCQGQFLWKRVITKVEVGFKHMYNSEENITLKQLATWVKKGACSYCSLPVL